MPGKAPNTEPPSQLTARGKTLRDWFAGQALHDAARIAAERMNIASGNSLHEGMARCAYEIADAMLAERDKL